MRSAIGKVIDKDIVIVGGGAAGAHAALKAHSRGADVLLLVKGFLGRSGCSIFAGNLQMVRATASAEEEKKWLQVRAKHMGHYLLDQDYVRRANLFTETEFYPEMERKGLYIRRTSNGNIVTNIGKAHNMWAPLQGYSGTFVMDILRKEILSKGIGIMEETMATSLLTSDGEVAGVTALNYARGEAFAVRAKAVIVATGPSNYLALRSTATREQCGNGFAMAYRAGAEMQDLEIQWWHCSDIAAPRAWMRLHIYPNPMPATSEAVRLYNSEGKMFFEQKMYPLAMQPYFLQLKHLCKEVTAGLARWHGGYYAGYTHIDPKIMGEYSYQTRFYRELGIDISKDLIECGITWHMTLGGVRTNTDTMETSVPGLYAAGGAGSHGVGTITFVSYDGTVAAGMACDRADRIGPPHLDEGQLEGEARRVWSLVRTEPKDGFLPAQVKKRIREIMWEKMGYTKNERQMLEALDLLAQVREEMVPRMRLGSDTRNWNYDWVDAIDVLDMLDVCEITIRSSLMRRESRGPFYREDYPFIDNKNELKHTVVRKIAGAPEIRRVPVDLKYISPEKDVEEFFSADY